MMEIWLAFWIYTTSETPEMGMRPEPSIEECWKEAAKLQEYWAENHPHSKHFQIDVSCISEWYDEL
jgi:hypothetical protein